MLKQILLLSDEALQNLEKRMRYDDLFKKSELQQIEVALNLHIKSYPGDANVLRVRGLFYMKKQNYSEALMDFQIIEKLNQLDFDTLYYRVKLFILTKKIKEADQELAKFNESQDYPPLVVLKGQIMEAKGNFKQAEEFYKQALNIDNMCEEAYFSYGIFCYNRGREKEATQLGLSHLKLVNLQLSGQYFDKLEQFNKSNKEYEFFLDNKEQQIMNIFQQWTEKFRQIIKLNDEQSMLSQYYNQLNREQNLIDYYQLKKQKSPKKEMYDKIIAQLEQAKAELAEQGKEIAQLKQRDAEKDKKIVQLEQREAEKEQREAEKDKKIVQLEQIVAKQGENFAQRIKEIQQKQDYALLEDSNYKIFRNVFLSKLNQCFQLQQLVLATNFQINNKNYLDMFNSEDKNIVEKGWDQVKNSVKKIVGLSAEALSISSPVIIGSSLTATLIIPLAAIAFKYLVEAAFDIEGLNPAQKIKEATLKIAKVDELIYIRLNQSGLEQSIYRIIQMRHENKQIWKQILVGSTYNKKVQQIIKKEKEAFNNDKINAQLDNIYYQVAIENTIKFFNYIISNCDQIVEEQKPLDDIMLVALK